MNPPQPVAALNAQLPQDNDEINLLELFDVVLDSRWLIAAVTLVSLLIGGGYALLSTPIYEANTLIQVEESKAGGGAAAGALGEAASLFEIRSPASAEMEILRSRMVVGQAVQNLQLDYSVVPKYIPLVGDWLARRATTPSSPGFLGMAGYVSGNESLKVATLDVPLDEASLNAHLGLAYAPDPDLLIRTGGESRISNFMLWQLAYTEMFFTDVLWPSFTADELDQSITWYRVRDRRFGGASTLSVVKA